jgi:RNA polymerase sigma factor (sigma-70 family)
VGEDEFAALYLQHRSALVWYLRGHGATPAEAADAVQDAFTYALRDADQVGDRRAWPSWLRTVAFRCYLKSVGGRGSSGQDRPAPVTVVCVPQVPDSAVAAEPAADAELRAQEEFVLSLLAALPMQQRRVFTLHYEGWASAEIAAQLGMHKAAVRQNIARARSALRSLLMQDSVTQGDFS